MRVDIQKYTNSKQLSEWAEMVSAYQNSGKTILARCTENFIKAKKYYYRQKKVCDAMPDLHRATPLPVTLGNTVASFAVVPFGLHDSKVQYMGLILPRV